MRRRGLMLVAGMRAGEQRAQQQAAGEQARHEGAAQAQTAAATPATKDVTAELQKLADLHKSGVLTAEEFAAAKKKLLG